MLTALWRDVSRLQQPPTWLALSCEVAGATSLLKVRILGAIGVPYCSVLLR